MSRPTLGRRVSSQITTPKASLSRMIFTPLIRLSRVLNLPIPTKLPTSPSNIIGPFKSGLYAAIQRLDLSTDPRVTLHRLQNHQWTIANTFPYIFMGLCATFSLYIMTDPPFPYKLAIPLAYILTMLLPITNQFVLPATPIFAWLITFFSARFIPSEHRPSIHVNLLPALESVMYGANISDLQTRYTNSFLDVLAWLPYGVLHFTLPFVVALILWVMGPKGSIQYWGRAFGFMNLCGVLTQLVLPCAAPWYEIIHGLTPANYNMPGSPGGLMRIDRVFHSNGYTNTFGHAPLVFGAFPSLHSGCAVMEALFLSHFFPNLKTLYWGYVSILWWSTMYLSHHYLIDLAGGACLSVLVFYLWMPEEFKDSDQVAWETGRGEEGYAAVEEEEEELDDLDDGVEGEHEDLDLDEEIRKLEEGEASEEDEERDRAGGSAAPIGESNGQVQPPGRKKARSVSWGATRVMGEESPRASGEQS